MKRAEVKFNYNNGKGIVDAQKYAEELFKNGFRYSHTDFNGGKVYHHYQLNLDVLVYVA